MKGLFLATGYAASWGIGITLSKLALDYFRPFDLLMVQLLSSVTILVSLLFFIRGPRGLMQLRFKNGIAGIFEPGMSYMFGTSGLALTSAVNASLIGSSEVLVTIVVAAVVLRETLPFRRLLLAIVGAVGVVMISGADAGEGARLLGDGLVFIGVLFAVVYTMISKSAVRSVEPLALVSAQQLLGLLTILPVWALIRFGVVGASEGFGPVPTWAWSIAVLSGVSQYAVAYLLYLSAIKDMNVSRAAFFLILIPVFASVSAFFILGERLTLYQIVGGALILACAYLAERTENNTAGAE